MQPYGSSGIGVPMTQQAWDAKAVMPESLANQINEALTGFLGKEIINIHNLKGGFIIFVASENHIKMIVDKLSALKGFSSNSKDSFSYHGYPVIIEEPEIFELDVN